jgi:hypothetical protein
MEAENKPLNIHQRMAGVMGDVKYILKDKIVKNKHGSEMYRVTSHDTVIREIRPSFIRHGILAVPSVEDHERVGSNLTILRVRIEFVNIDDPKDYISVTYYGYGIDTSDKGVGKAVSYAVRYAYLKVLSLETGDDPENDNNDFKEELISEEQIITLREICDSKNFPSAATLQRMAEKFFEVKKIQEITKTQFELAKKELVSKPANQPK